VWFDIVSFVAAWANVPFASTTNMLRIDEASTAVEWAFHYVQVRAHGSLVIYTYELGKDGRLRRKVRSLHVKKRLLPVAFSVQSVIDRLDVGLATPGMRELLGLFFEIFVRRKVVYVCS
jgi:hypothetical protein